MSEKFYSLSFDNTFLQNTDFEINKRNSKHHTCLWDGVGGDGEHTANKVHGCLSIVLLTLIYIVTRRRDLYRDIQNILKIYQNMLYYEIRNEINIASMSHVYQNTMVSNYYIFIKIHGNSITQFIH